MSTSASDGPSGGGGGGDQKPPPEKPADKPGGVGVAGLFKKAVAAHQAKATPNQVVAQGMELPTCKHCGAPRQREDLVCHFCKEKL